MHYHPPQSGGWFEVAISTVQRRDRECSTPVGRYVTLVISFEDRKLLDQVTLPAMFHIDVIDIEAAVASDDHDLRAATAHSYDTAQWASW